MVTDNMDSTALTVIGILIGILVFGFKIGIGCGFSNLRTRDILAVASIYFCLSLVFGMVSDRINLDSFQKISSLGMDIHIVISLLLITAGIYTQKKWNCGCDVSKHTFFVISMPCPVCLAALAVCCILLASAVDIGGLKIGVLVGTAFFIAITGFSLLFKKMGKTPETLGTSMMLIGLYYLLGALLIPAYMKMKKMNLPPMDGGSFGIEPLFILGLIILGGFFLGYLRSDQ